jgi:hypothetical protein
MNVLVVDVGGSHVKFLVSDAEEPRRFDSHPGLEPREMVQNVRERTSDWNYDAVSLGVPARIGPRGPLGEPGNLGDGWIDFDFHCAFERPVRLVNDAAMQALGAYDKGRMLFLGLGTGLGSALITERVIVPLELGNLTWNREETLAERLGKKGLQKLGRDDWEASVHRAVAVLQQAFAVDDTVLGGGQAEVLQSLPVGVRRGGNHDAFTGGFRLWEEWVEPHDRTPSSAYRLVI